MRMSRVRFLHVRGESMAPAMSAGDLWVMEVCRGKAGGLRRGAIVAWRPSRLRGKLLIKRLVGLPGEEVCSRKLGPDQFFLLGDNRRDSLDSRRLGPARLEELAGVVRCRLWKGG